MRGKNISWRHLQQLYDAKLAMSSRSSGLYLIQKLKQEHVNLTSFSRMHVDLAAEVSAYTSLPAVSISRNGTVRNGMQGYFTERTSVIAERLI